jgi:ABC-type Fe3+/spermidine/putrescine transport system ATPase subunit
LQRVAIARALVIEPEVLLLDEPLSNLDAKLRVEMRGEIRELQQQLGITAVYVTHDQEEALSISDRIAVMRAGAIEQIGTPAQIYGSPATPFVAEFMGTTNLLSGEVTGTADGLRRVSVSGIEFLLPAGSSTKPDVTFALRPETLRLLAPGVGVPPGWAQLSATVMRVEFLGVLTRVILALTGDLTFSLALLDLPPEAVAAGATVRLAYDPARVTVFEPA